MKLATQIVEKPWGRRDISADFGPAAFGDFDGRQIGEIWYDAPDGKPLPLLVKWLFTSEKLSVQVHPNDAQARARGMTSGKEECWYIVDAQPDAVLGMGTKKPLNDAELRAASLSGEIEALLDWKPVQAGDYFYIPAGTVHAIGAGVTLVEIQQNADITYRLYDYNRLDNGNLRELHLVDGIAVSQAEPYNDRRCGNLAGDGQLVDEGKFNLWLVTSEDGLSAIPSDKQRWLTPLDGEVYLGNHVGRVGECLLAASGEDIKISPNCRMLVAYQ